MSGIPRIVAVGELLWDLLPQGRQPGGAPGNFCCHAAWHGAAAHLVSAVGRDADGDALLAELRGRGVDVAAVAAVAAAPTGTVGVTVRDGQPTYLIHAPVAWDFIPATPALDRLAATADAVMFNTLGQRNEAARRTIRQLVECTAPDCLRVMDVNLRQDFYSCEVIEYGLRHATLFKVSEEELPAVADALALPPGRDWLAELRRRYRLRHAVLTCGAAGSRYCGEAGDFSVPAVPPARVVDTVGCGDAFVAVLTVGLLRGEAPRRAMERASEAAGMVAGRAGAMPQ